MCHTSQGFVNVMLNGSQKSVKIKNLSVFLMLFGTTDRRSNKLRIQEYSGTGPKKFRSEHVSEHLDSLSRITWTHEPGTKCSQVVTCHTL